MNNSIAMYRLLLLVLLCVCIRTSSSSTTLEKELTFTVSAGKTDCFYENVNNLQLLDVEYQVIDASRGELAISFQLTDPRGRVIVADYKKTDNAHQHTAQITGDYRFCFDNTFSTFSEKTVFFDLMVSNNNDNSSERELDESDADKELQMSPVSAGMVLRDVLESVQRTRDRISTARRLQELLAAHEARDRNLAELTCARVLRRGALSMMLMLVVGLTQVIFVRSLFDDNNSFKKYLPAFITN